LLLGAAIAASMGIGYAIGAQPHMSASIGGLALVDQATSEVRAGIAFAGH
jgi:hypothetical protein